MKKNKKNKAWYQYLWIASVLYMILGLFNIMFAWLGLICFITPVLMSIFGGKKNYCNKYCGRGQLFSLLGGNLKLSKNKKMPRFLKTKAFRYSFLAFFMIMFANIILNTYLVFNGAKNIGQAITLLWTFKVPWNFTDLSNVTPGFAQFAFGFFSLMLTSTILGVITMFLFKPRSWCVICPVGTMTQGICLIKDTIKKKIIPYDHS